MGGGAARSYLLPLSPVAQAFHPNKPPPSDLVLASNSRDAGSMENEYQRWLVKLRAACTAARVVLLFDEVRPKAPREAAVA